MRGGALSRPCSTDASASASLASPRGFPVYFGRDSKTLSKARGEVGRGREAQIPGDLGKAIVAAGDPSGGEVKAMNEDVLAEGPAKGFLEQA